MFLQRSTIQSIREYHQNTTITHHAEQALVGDMAIIIIVDFLFVSLFVVLVVFLQ